MFEIITRASKVITIPSKMLIPNSSNLDRPVAVLEGIPVEMIPHVALLPGDASEMHLPELDRALGGVRIAALPGYFVPANETLMMPILAVTPAHEAQDIELHVFWDEQHPALAEGLNSGFAKQYCASWYHRFAPIKANSHEAVNSSESAICCEQVYHEDIWVLPANGPAKFICDTYASQVNDALSRF